jgi:hypothetical protein
MTSMPRAYAQKVVNFEKVQSFFERKVPGNLTDSGFILKNCSSRLSEMLAFMNRMFGFSGSRDKRCKKTFLQSVGELHRKSYPQLREKATQHENKECARREHIDLHDHRATTLSAETFSTAPRPALAQSNIPFLHPRFHPRGEMGSGATPIYHVK